MVADSPRSPRATVVLLSAASVVVILAGLRAASALLVPVLLAAFVAILAMPILQWLARRRISPVVGTIVVLFIIVVIGTGIALLVSASMQEFFQDLPSMREKLTLKWHAMLEWVESHGGGRFVEPMREGTNPQTGVDSLVALLGGLRDSVSSGVLILFTLIFLLLEAAEFPIKLKAMLRDSPQFANRALTIAGGIRHYTQIKAATSFATGVLIAGWLMFLGVDYALVWGLLAFVLNFVPTIGSIIAAIPAVALVLVDMGALTATWTLTGYLGVNLLVGNLLEPRIMGQQLGLSPLVIFISLVLWGWVLGPVGMLLAVPLTMCVRIAAESSSETEWLAILLAPASGKAKAVYAEEEVEAQEPEA